MLRLTAMGFLCNIASALALAYWQPPWQVQSNTAALNVLLGDEPPLAHIRARLPIPEVWPQVLRRAGDAWRSGFGWRCDDWSGDAALGVGQLEVKRFVIRSGWPAYALRGEYVWVSLQTSQASRFPSAIKVGNAPSGNPGEYRILPVMPLPLGVAIGTALWTAALALVASPFWLRGWLRSRHRQLCPRCGYDLRGAVDRGCPECGFGRDQSL